MRPSLPTVLAPLAVALVGATAPLRAAGGQRVRPAEPARAPTVVATAVPSAAPPARPSVRVAGVVFDSLLNAPLAGATVTRDGATALAFTDSTGRFTLEGVDPAPGRFVVSHPGLDSIGLADVPLPFDLSGAADGVEVRLATPSRATLWARICGGALPGRGADHGMLFGEVRDARTGAPAADARAEVRWVAVDTSPKARRSLQLLPETRASGADSAGTWASCGLPLGEALEVSASAGGAESGAAAFAIGPRGVARLDLWLPPAAAAAPTTPTGGAEAPNAAAELAETGAVAGVVRDTAGQPRRDVSVRVLGLAGREARTGADGRFRLDGVPLGTGTLVVRAIGAAPQRVPIAVRPGAASEVEVTVRRVAMLAGVTVRAVRAPLRGALADVDVRRRSGRGYFADTAFIRRTGSIRAGITMVPTAQVREDRGEWAVYFRQASQSISAGAGQGMCLAKVVIDGMPSTWEMANLIAHDEVVAIEVYRTPTEVPPQYQTFAGLCGSVLIWTDHLR